jgi:predicted PurR-regulated permease PerM
MEDGAETAERGADDAAGHPPVLHLSITPRALASITVALVIIGAVVVVARTADEAIVWIALGLVLALALDPVIRALGRRGMTRKWAALAVGCSALLVAALVMVLVGPPAVDQAQKFEAELPETVQGFYDLPVVGDWLQENDAEAKVEEFVDDLPARIDNATVSDTADSIFGGAMSVVMIFTLAFAIMLDGENLVRRTRRLIPEAHRAQADRTARVLYRTFGNYFGGTVTVAVMSGAYVTILGLVFGVPLAPVAGMWAMVTNVIPQVGGFLGGSFVTILALSVSVPTAIGVGLLFVVYMNFENNVIQPAIIGEAVDLSPPVTMLAVLIGGAAAGLPGALVSTPVVGATKRLYLEARGQAPPESDHSPSFRERIRKLTGH